MALDDHVEGWGTVWRVVSLDTALLGMLTGFGQPENKN
jgi:hypothetical protein